MNSGNLINSLSQREYYAWHRWLVITRCGVAIVVIFLLASSINRYWHFHCLQKKVNALHKKVNTDAMQKHAALDEWQHELKQKLKKVKQWKNSYYYQNHLKVLANTIPSNVLLSSVYFEGKDAVIKGQTQALEFLLEFLHALEQTKLFKSMNLMELQPSAHIYGDKNLIHFCIKGSLNCC